MKTEIFTDEIEKAAKILQNGGLVAVPTETVYGLAGNGLDSEAVEKIYEVKGRPAIKPLALMVCGPEAMEEYCREAPPAARCLAEKFWPGPLTIVLKAKKSVPEIVRAGGDTVGLRCPDHPMTLALLKQAKIPFAAPSANPTGSESPKNAQEVLAYFDGKIQAVVDGGPCGLGRESTIIDLSETPYRILRQGALPRQEIENELVEKLKIIGITGGTGCGKTTALSCLERRGALLIDCDALYHEMLRTDREMLEEITARFAGVTVDGRLDTKLLGAIVFYDKSALEDLNVITHKHVDRRVSEILRDFAMCGGRLAAIDAIALLESGISQKCSAVVGVLADYNARIERIMKRDNISREYAENRVKSQKSDEFYRQKCDYILVNSSTEEEFYKQCEKLFEEIL